MKILIKGAFKLLIKFIKAVPKYIKKDINKAGEFYRFAKEEWKEIRNDPNLSTPQKRVDLLRCALGNLGFRSCRQKDSEVVCTISYYIDCFYLVMFPLSLFIATCLFYDFLGVPSRTNPGFLWRSLYDKAFDLYILFAEAYALSTGFINKYHTCIRKRAGYIILVLWIGMFTIAVPLYILGYATNEKAFDAIFWYSLVSIAVFLSRSGLVKLLELLEKKELVEKIVRWFLRKALQFVKMMQSDEMIKELLKSFNNKE